MRAEIISVGTELLLGQIVNTDAQYLARKLSEIGIDVYHQVVVGDNRGRLIECLSQAFSRSDIVITTGGLGPTMDDLTKEAVSEFFDLALEPDAESERRLRLHFGGMNREMTPNNLRQIYFPRGAKVLINDYGTAPGCIVERDDHRVIVLPGPPHELEGMFSDQVIHYLRELSSDMIVSRTLRVFGVGESAVEHRLREIIDRQTNPTIAPYASVGEVTLRLTVKCKKDEDAQKLLDPLEEEVRTILGDAVYATGEETMERVVARRFLEARKTLAIAESCTGGLIASMLTSIPGISEVFLEGFVTYSNAAKVRQLGVRTETLKDYGAVSVEVAEEMAAGAREHSGADYALAVTGIAGPDGGDEKKPLGLVYLALADKTGIRTQELRLHGTRERIRRMSALNALDMFRRAL